MGAKHFGQPVGEGTYTAGDGALHWELNGVTTDSTKVECATPCSSRVIRIEGVDSDGEHGTLTRS